MSWTDILGHERHVEQFREIVRRGRLAHAYLFVGPAGVGKRMFALELAKALLCERNEPGRLDACGQCESCRLVDAQTHPDFFRLGRPWIDPTDATARERNELPIGLMQELCAGFGLKAARGRGKVAVVDDADDFNQESANCFLKTLEEPPPRSLFILIGTSLDGQLPTIRSRCQIIRFAPLPEAIVKSVLQKHELADPGLASRLVKLAAGSPGQALDLADPALWDFRKRLLQGLARPKIDTIGLARSFTEFAEDAGKETVLHRRRAALVLKLLIEAWSDVLDAQMGAAAPAAPAEETALLEPLARRSRPDQILRVLERCLETEAHLDRYVQVGLVAEALIDALAQILES
jgi:DNA polymerase-3 subunit delta'